MPQVTLSVSNEKMPLLQDFLSAMGIEDKKAKNILPRTVASSKTKTLEQSAKSFYKKYFSWEYFSNELEFE